MTEQFSPVRIKTAESTVLPNAKLRSPYNNAVRRFKPVFISMIFSLAKHAKLILGALAFELVACNYKLTYKNLHENILN